MNAVLDFIRGIAPWVIPAILLVIFAVRAAARDKRSTKHENNRIEPDALTQSFAESVSLCV